MYSRFHKHHHICGDIMHLYLRVLMTQRLGCWVAVPLGDDFRYDTMKEARAQFDNYKRIMDFINSHPEYKVCVCHAANDVV